MNAIAQIGHNGGPRDIMEEIQATYDDTFAEVANWLDGTGVESEEQMAAVDALLAYVKSAEKEAAEAKEAEYRPHKKACDAVVARWKPFLADLERQQKGLIAAVNKFKQALAAKKDAERRTAEQAAWESTRKAREAAQAAEATGLEAQRAAAFALEQAEAAQRVANAAKRDTVKGMRTYTVREITDGTACARWLWANDREALLEYMADRVKRIAALPDGVSERTEKRAV